MKRKKQWLAIGILLAAALLFNLAARSFGGFAEWYASAIYPVWVNTIGRLLSPLPFSAVEFLLYGGILLVLYWLARGIVRLAKGKRDAGEVLLSALKKFLLTGGILLLVFTLGGGINYQRKTFGELAGLPVEKSTAEELKALCRELAEAVNQDAEGIHRNEEGLCQVDGGLRGEAVEAMRRLGESYPFLSGYYPKPKPICVSDILSYQQVTGIYSPFTLEANYNRDIPGYNLPHTLCHELSHLKGFMREDEANFISYLACIFSDVPEFRYSGNLTAFVYAGNALAGADAEAYREIRSGLSEKAEKDLAYNNWFWQQFEGPVAEAATQMNNTYLKANSQEDGTKSYGRMVDLLLAYRRSRQP